MGVENRFEQQKGINRKKYPKTETDIADLQAEKQKEKTEKVEEVLADLQLILDIEDPEIQEQAVQTFVDKRLQELSKEVPEKQPTLSLVGNKSQGEFIHPETEIKRSWIVDGFKVNDPDIYKSLLKSFTDIHNEWNKRQTRSVIGHSIVYALGDYFGNYYGTENTEKRNIEFYSDHTTLDSEAVNLAELKGKNLAVCAEKRQ